MATRRRFLIPACAAVLALAVTSDGGAAIVFEPGLADLNNCVVPRAAERLVLYNGVFATFNVPISELEDAFPETWNDRPRLRVLLAIREPGLLLTFDKPVRVSVDPEQNITVDPPEVVGYDSAVVTSMRVMWPPSAGVEYYGRTSFGSACGRFVWSIGDEVPVTAHVVTNLVAEYGSPGDVVEVWGSEVGIADVELVGTGIAGHVPVLPATWGQLKGRFISEP